MRRTSLLIFVVLFTASFPGSAQSDNSLENRRESMVERLDELYNLQDSPLRNAFSSVPRDLFVPASFTDMAYGDSNIPLGDGIVLPKASYYLRVLRGFAPEKDQKVLIAGYGTGYAAALMSFLVKEVYVAEFSPRLAENYEQTLEELDITNVAVSSASGFHFWSDQSPFDIVFIHGALRTVPAGLVGLTHQNSKIVLSYADESGFQILTLIERSGGLFSIEQLGGSLLPLLGEL